jgi:hypothetical protein
MDLLGCESTLGTILLGVVSAVMIGGTLLVAGPA